ncbi:hypothetical protein [Methylobacterium sp. P1-11]|uniref:hypothetical protein n=1 Tax=Methylobacterium sp. P1-11 TaxID=2024616 RepID=UPI0011EC11E3|nr:hypothetical protein [Methylobacterium sp. P1-11]
MGNGTHTPGAYGALGLVTEGHHALHVLLEPFAGCDGLWSCAARFYALEGNPLWGSLLAAAFIIASLYGLAHSSIKLAQALFGSSGDRIAEVRPRAKAKKSSTYKKRQPSLTNKIHRTSKRKPVKKAVRQAV